MIVGLRLRLGILPVRAWFVAVEGLLLSFACTFQFVCQVSDALGCCYVNARDNVKCRSQRPSAPRLKG